VSALGGRLDPPDVGPADKGGASPSKSGDAGDQSPDNIRSARHGQRSTAADSRAPENLSEVMKEICAMKALLHRAVSGQVCECICRRVLGVCKVQAPVPRQVTRGDLDLLMAVLKQSVSSCQELVQAREVESLAMHCFAMHANDSMQV
jgi:hypothetical protein